MVMDRFFVFGVIPALFLQGIGAYLYFVVLADTPIASPMYGAVKICLVLWPLFWLLRGAALPRFRLPINTSTVLSGIAVGVTMAMPVMVAAFVLYDMLVPYAGAIASKADDLFPLAYYIPITLLFSMVHALFEEYFWRWFVFGGLQLYLRPLPAAIVASGGFTFHHLIILSQFFPMALTVLTSIGVFVGGLLWYGLYQKTKAITIPWISHMLVDATLFAIGYSLIF